MSIPPENPPAPVIPPGMTIPTLPIPQQQRIDGKTKLIIMPEELGGKVYKTLNYYPQHVVKSMRALTDDNGDYLPGKEMEIMEITLKGLVIDPRITDEYLRSDDCNSEEMQLLAETIAEQFKDMKDRHETLKKKVILR